jgi:hypothetical protein
VKRKEKPTKKIIHTKDKTKINKKPQKIKLIPSTEQRRNKVMPVDLTIKPFSSLKNPALKN